LNIEPTSLTADLSIAGDHKTWRTKVETFCERQGFDPKRFIEAATRLLHPEAGRVRRNERIKERRLRKAIRQTQTEFSFTRNPTVPDFLRRIVAYLMDLAKAGKPLPVAVTT